MAGLPWVSAPSTSTPAIGTNVAITLEGQAESVPTSATAERFGVWLTFMLDSSSAFETEPSEDSLEEEDIAQPKDTAAGFLAPSMHFMPPPGFQSMPLMIGDLADWQDFAPGGEWMPCKPASTPPEESGLRIAREDMFRRSDSETPPEPWDPVAGEQLTVPDRQSIGIIPELAQSSNPVAPPREPQTGAREPLSAIRGTAEHLEPSSLESFSWLPRSVHSQAAGSDVPQAEIAFSLSLKPKNAEVAPVEGPELGGAVPHSCAAISPHEEYLPATSQPQTERKLTDGSREPRNPTPLSRQKAGLERAESHPPEPFASLRNEPLVARAEKEPEVVPSTQFMTEATDRAPDFDSPQVRQRGATESMGVATNGAAAADSRASIWPEARTDRGTETSKVETSVIDPLPEVAQVAPRPPGALRQIRIEVGREQGAGIQLNVIERANRIQVSVHSADSGIRGALRSGLEDLTERFEKNGVSVEPGIHPRRESALQPESPLDALDNNLRGQDTQPALAGTQFSEKDLDRDQNRRQSGQQRPDSNDHPSHGRRGRDQEAWKQTLESILWSTPSRIL